MANEVLWIDISYKQGLCVSWRNLLLYFWETSWTVVLMISALVTSLMPFIAGSTLHYIVLVNSVECTVNDRVCNQIDLNHISILHNSPVSSGCSAAALLEHTKRAAFQAGYIWGQCLVPKPFVPSPGDWEVWWTTESCMDYTSWGRKGLLRVAQPKICKWNCKCHRANLQCTSLCTCDGQCYENWVSCEA